MRGRLTAWGWSVKVGKGRDLFENRVYDRSNFFRNVYYGKETNGLYHQ